jgi:hypothetical protein
MVMDVGEPADWVKINVRQTVSFTMIILFNHMVHKYYNVLSSEILNILLRVVSPCELPFRFELKLLHLVTSFVQKECFEIYALVPGLLREEVRLHAQWLHFIDQLDHCSINRRSLSHEVRLRVNY